MRLWLILALFAFIIAEPAAAQQQEPPSRVGAVSFVSGNIAFRAAGDTQWSAAGVNYPVASGGSFWIDPQARAQIQIGPSTIGVAGGTELDITQLNDQVSQLGLPQGRINLHLRNLETGQSFEVDLPQGSVWLLQPGSYDIDAGSQDQPGRVAVFAGTARFAGGGADLEIRSGDAAVLSGSNPVTASIERAAPDAFVEWCNSHDHHAQGLAATHYVSPQMTGYADFDQYGGWQRNSQYGEIWYPNQTPADWAPYRDGHWIWVQPWGWTWVDEQPWGFAPFHYGRWAYVDDRWGWVPGSYVAQPVYAPALVAFVGAVAGVGLAASSGPAVGWFPLAPGETYWPSYTRNAYYIRNVNVANVRNINTVIVQSNGAPPQQVAAANFANRRFATVVPQRVFAAADPVAPAAIRVPAAVLAQAPVAVHPPQVSPAPRPAAVAARAPQNPRPLQIGTGRPPPARPAASSGLAGAQPHTAGTPPAHAVEPGRPGAAAIPPHPGGPERAANTPAAAPHGPATAALPPPPPHPAAVSGLPVVQPHPPGTPPGHAVEPGRPSAASNAASIPPHPGAPERAANTPATTPHGPATAALPPPHPGAAAPPARETPPKAIAPARSPSTAVARQEERPVPADRRPPPITEPRPVAAPHPHPPAPIAHPPTQAQIVRPPAPAAIVHPPSPPARPAPAVARPAPAVPRPAPAAAHAPPPAPAHAGPHPAGAPAAAHGGGKSAPKEEGKKGDDHH